MGCENTVEVVEHHPRLLGESGSRIIGKKLRDEGARALQ